MFLARGDQGVNYRRNVWHHPLIAMEAPSDFIVVDRLGGGEGFRINFALRVALSQFLARRAGARLRLTLCSAGAVAKAKGRGRGRAVGGAGHGRGLYG